MLNPNRPAKTRGVSATLSPRVMLFALALTLLPARAFCQIVPPAPQTIPSVLTLHDAIAIALEHQPTQYIARAQITQAQGQKLQAQSQYFPTISPSYQYQNSKQNLYGVATGTSTTTGTGTTGTTTGTTGTTGTGTTTPSVQSSVNEVNIVRGGGLTIAASETLFDTGSRETTNYEARRAVEAADYNNINTRQSTILTVTQDYYQLLLNLDLVKVAQAQVARYQQAVDVAQAQVQAGSLAPKDVYQAQSDLANAQVTLLQDQNSVQIASSTLKNAIGVATDVTVQPAPLAAENQLPPVPREDRAVTLDDSLAVAYANRPDLRQQQATVASENAAVSQAKRDAGLSVKGDYTLTYQATNDIGNRGLNSQFLLTGSAPLLDAGNARGAIRISQGQRDVAADTLEQVRQQIRLDVEQAYNTRATNLQAASLAQTAVTAAQVNYDATVAARREGIGTVLDITTAQASLTQAQDQYVTAVYNFYTADAQLQRAIGRNDMNFR